MPFPKLVKLIFVAHLAGAAQFTFVWTPHARDIGPAGTPEYRQLEALLAYIGTEPYVITAGDSLDYIIRKRFLISVSERNGYGLFMARILELNPQLAQHPLLIPGRTLMLPLGPKFSATEVADQALPKATQSALTDTLTRYAYEAASLTSGMTIARRDLARYVDPAANSDGSKIAAAIKDRGIVSARAIKRIRQDPWPLLQVYDITVPAGQERASAAALTASRTGVLLPGGLVPMASSIKVACNGCAACGDILRVPPTTDLTHARLLIEDTGVNATVSSGNLIPPGVSSVADDSDDFHGTFVYSEVAAPSAQFPSSHGVLPPSAVYVAKTARRVTDGSFQFAMKDMLTHWQSFASVIFGDPGAANTVVVNISAEGAPSPDTLLPDGTAPQLPGGNRMLVVAAAGNSNNNLGPVFDIFGELSTDSAPLLIVGASATQDTRSTYSNWHPTHVQLFTRGDCVCGSPGQISGTSQAAPIVATAAAVLASDRSNWNARQVMWRLISSADAAPQLNGFSLAGKLNLPRALTRAIAIATTTQPVTTPSVTFDDSWSAEITRVETEVPNFSVIKFQRPHSGTDGKRCFDALLFQSFQPKEICVPPTAVLNAEDENGQAIPLQAADIVDIVLPMPTDRAPNSAIPKVVFQLDGTV